MPAAERPAGGPGSKGVLAGVLSQGTFLMGTFGGPFFRGTLMISLYVLTLI